MIPDWALTFLSSGAGALIAAWAVAYLGFRRSKKERALDRRIEWHESAIESLAQYEEELERMDRHIRNVLLVQGPRDRPASVDPAKQVNLPTHIKIPETLWSELRDAESRARGALRVSSLYVKGPARFDCSSALLSSVNVVSSQWMDISAAPSIPWAELSGKAYACAGLRRSLEESMKVVLELDGLFAKMLGPKYRKWREIRLLKGRLAELDENARKSIR